MKGYNKIRNSINGFKQFVRERKRDTILVGAVAVVIAFICVVSGTLPEAKASVDLLAPKPITPNATTTVGSGITYFKGDPNTVYDNVTITAEKGATIILHDVHIRQTKDKPALVFVGGYDYDDVLINDYKLIIVGDCVIESVYEGAESALIRVEENRFIETKVDEIFTGGKKAYLMTNNELTITDNYEGTKYHGSLTLITAKDSKGAAIGSTGPSDTEKTIYPDEVIPGSDVATYYDWDYIKAGTINIMDEVNLNIYARGTGAAIGGAGNLYTGANNEDPNVAATSGGKINILGGSVRVIMAPGSYGTALGGGSVVRRVGTQSAPSAVANAGGGADVVIKGGSLYIETNGYGKDFGVGLGVLPASTYRGSVTDGNGNKVCMYIANVLEDEMSVGGMFTYDAITGNLGQFELEQVLGVEEYEYKVMAADYSSTDGKRNYILTKTLTSEGLDYIYSGIGHSKFIHDSLNNNIETTDISGKLYFYLPATEAVFYQVGVNGASKEHATISVTRKNLPITEARHQDRIWVDVEPEQDYEIKEVYYIDANGTKWPTYYTDGRYYFDMPESSVVIYVELEIPTYTITYENLAGATHNNPSKYTVRDHIVFTAPTAPGLRFEGWYDEFDNPITEIAKGSVGNRVITAKWEEELYTVTFVDYDGTFIYSAATTYGGTVVPPANPVKDNYEFIGWDTDFSYVTTNLTVKAMYNEVPIRLYNIYIDSALVNGKLTLNVTEALPGEEIIVTITPDVGYKITSVGCLKYETSTVGGYYNVNLNELTGEIAGGVSAPQTYIFEMPDYDVLLTAAFEELAYTITYINYGDDNSKNPTSYKTSTGATLYAATKDEYKFVGWVDSQGNVITEILPGTTGNLVLIGKWEPLNPKYDYKININKGITHGTIVANASSANEGDMVTITAVPDNGYKVKYVKYIHVTDLTKESVLIDTAILDVNEINFFMPADDIIVTAVFEAINYNIVYVDVDDSNNPLTYTVEDNIILNIPTKEGYIFDKWYDIDANEITAIEKGSTGNKIIIATWHKVPVVEKDYTITVDDSIINGKVVADKETAKAGETVVIRIEANKGYKIKNVKCLVNPGASGEEPTVSDLIQQSFLMTRNATLLVEDNVNEEVEAVVGQLAGNEFVFTMPEYDVIITVEFDYETYYITYIDGGIHNNPPTYTLEDEIILDKAVKEGYKFLAWYTKEGVEITKIALGTSENIALIAKWEMEEEEKVSETTSDEETSTEENTTENEPQEESSEVETTEKETTTKLTDNEPTVEDMTTGSEPPINNDRVDNGDIPATADINKAPRFVLIAVYAFMFVMGALLTIEETEEDE